MRGQTFEDYSWDQDLKYVYITIPVSNPKVKCNFCFDSIHVNEKNFSGRLEKPIDVNESIYWIEDGNTMKIELKKFKNCEWWSSVFLNSPEKLDVTKIPPIDSSFSEVEPEHRQIVEEMIMKQKNSFHK